MKNIDFLPESYNHQRALRRARQFWLGLGILLGLMISGAASGQWVLRRTLESQIRNIEPQFVVAQQRQAEIDRLLKSKQRMEEMAGLYSYLEYPWPKTQLLAAVVQPLPASIQLMNLHLVEQADFASVAHQADRDAHHNPGGNEKSQPLTPRSLLTQLRGEHDHLRTILEISGEAENTKELLEYVDALARSSLFASARLKGLDSASEGPTKKRAKFDIQIVVHPGYGQPGTPANNASNGDVAASGSTGKNETDGAGGLP